MFSVDCTDGEEAEERPDSLSERLAAGLLGLIAERRLGPGDALPTVRELAGRFGVTAPTMREALRRLQATDAVRLRHGSGIYVGPGVLRTLIPNPNPVPVSGVRILQLIQARLAVEPGIAALAARHRTDEQLARLEFTVEPAPRAQVPRGGRGNFHRELAGACGNPVLFEVVDSLLSARSAEQRAVRRLVQDRARDLDQHREILAAVREQEPGAAEELTRQHLHELRASTAALLAAGGRGL
ncbi:FadR/GntR family transcriptional regulator [Kitasatospora sp. NPDC052896]|uniref:FadR/GntR family transcriptional regulator n=1 Tax=Kitasatospora sp. NPDC052896 TaxID=3364061 RepID=UPI0037CB96FF